MPTPAGKLFANLLTQVGLSTADPKFADLLAISTEVPDDAAQAIASGLMTLEGAKNNPTVKNHFTAQVLNGVDSKIQEVMDELGIPEEAKAEILADKSSFNKIKLAATKISELGKKAAKNPEDIQKLVEEVNKLKKDLVDKDSIHKEEKQKLLDQQETSLLDYYIRNDLAGLDFAYDLPKDINVSTALTLLNKELAAKGAKAVREGDGIKLMSVEHPTLAYTENHQEVPWADFRSKALANNKLLKVTDPAKGGGNTPNTPIDGGPTPDQASIDFYDAQLKKLATSN